MKKKKKKKKKKRDFIFLYFLDAIKQEFIDISHTFRDATQRLKFIIILPYKRRVFRE